MKVQKLLSDVVGLSKVMPPLSRRGFMTSSAAAAAGYTLAAGPVRADVIRTDTNGLISGGAQVMVPGGNMPVYYARPANVQNPPIVLVAMEIFGLHEYIKDVTRRLGHLGAFAVASDFYFRKGVDLTKITKSRTCCQSSTASRTLSCSPISTPRLHGRSRKVVTAIDSASWASAVVVAPCGSIRPIIPTSRRASRSTARLRMPTQMPCRRTRSTLPAK